MIVNVTIRLIFMYRLCNKVAYICSNFEATSRGQNSMFLVKRNNNSSLWLLDTHSVKNHIKTDPYDNNSMNLDAKQTFKGMYVLFWLSGQGCKQYVYIWKVMSCDTVEIQNGQNLQVFGYCESPPMKHICWMDNKVMRWFICTNNNYCLYMNYSGKNDEKICMGQIRHIIAQGLWDKIFQFLLPCMTIYSFHAALSRLYML